MDNIWPFEWPRFVTLGIENSDELWNLIDTGTGGIAVSQFAQGLRIISEEAKAKDIFAVNRRIEYASRRLKRCVLELARQTRLLQRFEREISDITQQLTLAMREPSPEATL